MTDIPKIAALFPGQGSQYVGMASSFYENSQVAKAVLDEAEAALPGLLSLMFEGPADTLTLTENQQPALVAAGAAALAAYREAGGPEPSYVAGHSLGEFSAYVAAGSLSVAEAVMLVRKRGRYMQQAVPEGKGAMAAVMKVSPSQIATFCQEAEGVAEVANYNGDGQTVISGEASAIAAVSVRLKEQGARVMPLAVSAPFHCSLMQPAADQLRKDLLTALFNPLQIPLVANVTAETVLNVTHAPKLLTEQVTHSVRWTESVLKLAELGVTRYIELGSGKVLTGLVKRIIKGADGVAISDYESLQQALTSS